MPQYLQKFMGQNSLRPIPGYAPVQDEGQGAQQPAQPVAAAQTAPAPPMPSIDQIVNDQDFIGLPAAEKAKVLMSIDPDFSKLPEGERMRAVEMMGAPQQQEYQQQPGDFAGMLMDENRDAAIMDPQVRSNIYRPMLEGGGATVGSIIGATGGIAGGPAAPATMTAGGVAGAATGYTAGKQAADYLDILAGIKERPTMKETAIETGKDLLTGAAYEVGGQAAPAVIGAGAKQVGKVAKPLLGRLSGVGTGAVEEALKAGSSFDKALRGKITGEEIVENARTALNSLKDQRASTYQTQLAEVAKNKGQIDISGMRKYLKALMDKYNVVVDAAGKLDTSRIAMGKTGRKDIEEIIQTIGEWGSRQDDLTASGLDVLKRQLDDFYSDSSQARQFVTSIRNAVKRTITDNVPEYEKMVSGYAEATKLIKDIESGLMMRKQGISGRIVADQTLRRLMSSMKDNFTLRKELVDVLGAKGGEDLAGQIAGFTMRSPVPLGLAGTGPALAAEAAYSIINPKFWPVLAASSPRVQGEFLRLFGKLSKVPATAVKEGVRQSLIVGDDDDK